MRIAIHTLGTRGDIQPFLALALRLKAEDHGVLIAAPTQFEAFIDTRGIDFAPLPGEYLDLLKTEEGKAAMSGSGGFAAGFKLMRQFKPIGRKQLSQEWEAARRFRPELIIYHPKAVGVPHGGAGTTGAALRAGKPSVICPFFGDQPFWARRIQALGVGTAPLDIRKIDTASLAAAVREVTGNSTMRRKAMELGARIRKEDGVAAAISLLHARGLLEVPKG